MAASAQQISANRANAQLSTGPQNTARTKFNGVSHGMTARQTVIPGESQAEYDEFHATLVKQLARAPKPKRSSPIASPLPRGDSAASPASKPPSSTTALTRTSRPTPIRIPMAR